MQFREGTIVYFSSLASVDSLREYSKYRAKGLPLKCPCNFTQGEPLKIEKVLSSNLLLLRPIGSLHTLTIAVKSDLCTKQPLKEN